MRNTKALAIGEELRWSPKDRPSLVVSMQRIHAGTFHVMTMAGPHRLDHWTRSYATEIEARSAARHVALAFQQWGCEAAVNARRNALEFKMRDLLNSRRPSRNVEQTIAEVSAELDTLATLADREIYLTAIAG